MNYRETGSSNNFKSRPTLLTLAVGIATGYGLGTQGTFAPVLRLALVMWHLYGVLFYLSLFLIVVVCRECATDGGQATKKSRAYLRSLENRLR